jgi:hypothetical protein
MKMKMKWTSKKDKTEAIGRVLTQKLIKPNKIEKLIRHDVRGANFTMLKNNEVSNAMPMNIYASQINASFRFVVIGRTDLLPTPVNLQRQSNDRRDDNCRKCNRERRPTKIDIVNECTPNSPLMTKRYNPLGEVVRTAMLIYLENDIRSMI